MKKIIFTLLTISLFSCRTVQPTNTVDLDKLFSIVSQGYLQAEPLTPEVMARIKADSRLLTPKQKGQFLVYITAFLSPHTLSEIYKVCDFSEADLSGARLQYTYLRSCILNRANFEDAFLYKADLEDANLIEANFCKANLRGANMERAYIPGAIFCQANLENANMWKAVYRELRDGKKGMDESLWTKLDNAIINEWTILNDTSIGIIGYKREGNFIIRK